MVVESGAILDGTVEKLLDYGVIVSLPEGESGLIHISEVADEYVQSIADYFQEGDTVKVKVVAEKEKGRYELSAKQAEPRKPVHAGSVRPPSSAPSDSQPFEEKLSDFMKRSSQRINELRRSRDNRRKRGR